MIIPVARREVYRAKSAHVGGFEKSRPTGRLLKTL